MIRKILFIIIFIVIACSGYLFFQKKYIVSSQASVSEIKEEKEVKVEIIETDYTKTIEIKTGSTYGELMRESGVDYGEAMEIYGIAKDQYDLVKIRQGRFIDLTFDKKTDDFLEMRYKIDSEEELIVKKNIKNLDLVSTSTKDQIKSWNVEIVLIDYEIQTKISSGEVTSSMYQAALDNEIDERAIIELANTFQWTIDFAMDPRVGDTFKFIYEERYLDGEYVMPGQILAGIYINSGKQYEVYYFEESEDNKGYFDENGNSVQKMFLRAPVSFKFISSGFTTGSRYIQAFNMSTGHRAIDYATPAGTPIRSVGDGTVSFSGWGGSYGNKVSIRHNGTYTTNYCHQSRIGVKRGQKVKQGDIIGYVGSTGLSTGPHLHYEMVKNGVKVNPYNEILPPGKPINKEKKSEFEEVLRKYKEMLKNN